MSPTTRRAAHRAASGARTATPTGFPRVEPETQKSRDEIRRKVLSDELASEEKLLGEARVAYGNGAPQPLPDEQNDAENATGSGSRSCGRRCSCTSATSRRCGRKSPPSADRARRSTQAGGDRRASTAGIRSRGGRAASTVRRSVNLRRSTEPAACERGLDLLATAVLMLDADGRIDYANPAAENLFELSRPEVRRAIRWTRCSATAPRCAAAIERAIATGASYTEQELELGVAGKPKLHLTCTVSPIDSDDAALLLEFRHIDQQLKIAREERLLEQQQANRELIRSLAHEIKNPLGGIRGAAQLLERELDRPQLVEYTQVIIGEADRLRVARQSAARAAPAADVPADQHPRGPRAREGRRAGGVPGDPDRLRFRHEPARSSTPIPSS